MKEQVLGLAIYSAAAVWTVMVIWYSVRAKWWKGEYGINTWLVSFIIAVALDRLALLILFEGFLPPLLSYYIGFSTYFILAGAGVQRLYLLEKAQREGETSLLRRSTDTLK